MAILTCFLSWRERSRSASFKSKSLEGNATHAFQFLGTYHTVSANDNGRRSGGLKQKFDIPMTSDLRALRAIFMFADPFVGGGTVIVEAMRAGRFGIGSDISPLALFVSRGRTWTASITELEGLRKVSR